MNEAETRAEHVDPALKAAGWGVVERSRVLRKYPFALGRIDGHGRLPSPHRRQRDRSAITVGSAGQEQINSFAEEVRGEGAIWK